MSFGATIAIQRVTYILQDVEEEDRKYEAAFELYLVEALAGDIPDLITDAVSQRVPTRRTLSLTWAFASPTSVVSSSRQRHPECKPSVWSVHIPSALRTTCRMRRLTWRPSTVHPLDHCLSHQSLGGV